MPLNIPKSMSLSKICKLQIEAPERTSQVICSKSGGGVAGRGGWGQFLTVPNFPSLPKASEQVMKPHIQLLEPPPLKGPSLGELLFGFGANIITHHNVFY